MLRKKARRVPGIRDKYQYIAEGNLRPSDGVTQGADGNAHVTWWPDRRIERETRFSVVERIEA